MQSPPTRSNFIPYYHHGMALRSERARLAAQVRARLSQLGTAEIRVAQVVLEQGEALLELSVTDVATLAGTSPSTVVRACKNLGFDGYQALKIAVARESPPGQPDKASPDDVLSHATQVAVDALSGLTATVTVEDLRAAAAILAGAGQVLVTGAGLSGAVVLDAAYRLRALGCTVDAPADPLTAQLTAGTLTTTAACLAISHTGATRTTVDAARRARAAGATVIALTSYVRSPLTETSDHVLLAGGQDLTFGLEAVASRLAHLVVIDALALALLAAKGDRAADALSMSAEVTAHHSY